VCSVFRLRCGVRRGCCALQAVEQGGKVGHHALWMISGPWR
jgi:hypothetical protein